MAPLRIATTALALVTLAATGVLAAQELPVTPFSVHVPETVLRDLKQRLAGTRWPNELDDAQWDYGVPLPYLRTLVDYWREAYNWRRFERELNAFPQFTTTIDGVSVHFLHVRSPHAAATPLVLVHGWPGSVWEFHKIIGPLVDPTRFGGRAEDAFHIVVPSLIGFGFSGQPKERGWSNQRMAETIAKLMARLGYSRYGAQGGDWGSGIVRWLATNDGDHCTGSHSNFPPGTPPTDNPLQGVTAAEQKRYEDRAREVADHRAYSAIQGTRPQTIGYALNDSPAGLAAWIVDKFWAWSDHRGNLENSFSKDELLTNVTLYWVTQSMPSAVRIYYESQKQQARPSSMSPFEASRTTAPVGFAQFPKEITLPPRAWVERAFGASLIHWTEMPRGGHFAALEQPELLIEDVRAFFRRVRALPTSDGRP